MYNFVNAFKKCREVKNEFDAPPKKNQEKSEVGKNGKNFLELLKAMTT